MERLSLDEIVGRAQKGDETAFAQLMQATKEDLFRFCLYLCGNRSQADDLVQDAYMKVLTEISKLKEPGRFKSWLFQVAKNVHLDYVKSPKNKAHENEEALSDRPADAEFREFFLGVQQALAQLEDDEKIVLLLIDLEGHSYAEAADILKLSEAAVQSRLLRARKAFSERYNGD